MKLVFAFVVATLMPALLFAAWFLYAESRGLGVHDSYVSSRTVNLTVLCVLISAAHVVFLGIPAYLVLRRLHALRWWSIIGCGFVLGAVPYALLASPFWYANAGSYSNAGGVDMMINGHATLAGWLQYATAASFMGACGAGAALAFWLVSRTHEP